MLLLWIIISYLWGSIPFGLLIAVRLCHTDPRTAGSGNTGATNIARVCGLKYGLLTLLLDFCKGLGPVLIAMELSASSFFHGLIAWAAISGHAFSVFLRGKGGKAVATTAGAFCALSPWATLGAAVLFALTTACSGYVSLGSLVLITALSAFFLLSMNWALAFWAVCTLCLIFWRHKDNIDRLTKGTEKSWRKKTEK